MDLRPFDFFLAAVLIAGLPWWASVKYRRLRAAIAVGRPTARLAMYRNVLVVQWSLVVLLVIHWFLVDRSASGLRFALPLEPRLLGGMLVAGAAIVLLWLQLRSVSADPEASAKVASELGPLRAILPHDPHEARWFRAVAVTAGICEEVLYRGFLPWMFETVLPSPAAFLVAAVAFGIGHLYQGMGGVLKTTALGVLMAMVTWLTGSLLPAIVIHAAIDLLNGELAYRVLRRRAAIDPPPIERPDDPPAS